MLDGSVQRSYGRVFDEVAAEYDRHRPAYPGVLLDHLFDVAELGGGDRVLEIGCGTGQLTEALLARGLRVVAVEPGERLLALARANLGNAADVEFVNARLEDAQVACGDFRAVISASAIHWIDPDVGWRIAAEALAPSGTLALIQHFALEEPRSADDQRALLGSIRKVAPETAEGWPPYRDLETVLAGVHERRGNISDAWGWLGSYDISRDYAAHLFDDAQIATVRELGEHTAAQVNALLGTLSFWSRLSQPQREELERENLALHERLGRALRSSVLACAVTARRAVCVAPA